MSREAEALAEELLQLAACVGSPHVRWANGFTVRKPEDLGRTPEGRLLRRLYTLSLRVRGRRPFDIALLSGRRGQSMAEWLEEGVAAFERWLGLSEHEGDDAADASAECSVHAESHRLYP